MSFQKQLLSVTYVLSELAYLLISRTVKKLIICNIDRNEIYVLQYWKN